MLLDDWLFFYMPRKKRKNLGNIVYHVLNRANGRLRIFKKAGDFSAFEKILAEGLARFPMRLLENGVAGKSILAL